MKTTIKLTKQTRETKTDKQTNKGLRKKKTCSFEAEQSTIRTKMQGQTNISNETKRNTKRLHRNSLYTCNGLSLKLLELGSIIEINKCTTRFMECKIT